jgi:hypothetical protein
LHAHIIPNIVKISLKRVEMNFCPGSKNSIIGKTQRKPARYDNKKSCPCFWNIRKIFFRKLFSLVE